MHPSNVRPQAVLPRTSRNAGHSLRQKPTTTRSSPTFKRVGASPPRRRGPYGQSSRNTADGGGMEPSARGTEVTWMADVTRSPPPSSPSGGGWGDVIDARRVGLSPTMPQPGELGLYMDTYVFFLSKESPKTSLRIHARTRTHAQAARTQLSLLCHQAFAPASAGAQVLSILDAEH